MELARERAIELLSGDVSNEKLVLSQSLSDSYKVKGRDVSITSPDSIHISQAHVQVVNKMRDRKPGSEPQSGDRVPYLLTKTGDPKAGAFEKSEDPKYVEENNIPVDYHYYFVNKFLNPVCDLLDPLFTNTKEEIFGAIINQHAPPKKKREPGFSGMKKEQLIEECKKRNLDTTGTIPDLKSRLKNNLEKQKSVADLFKNTSKIEVSNEFVR
jgi:DNA polymerase delta subunit 1